MGIQALLLISTSCIIMNLIQSINVISFVLLYSLSMISAGAYDRQAEWVRIGEKQYEFHTVGLNQGEASARCIGMGGKLFEPKDSTTNRDVFLQAGAKFPGATRMWIGVSDANAENAFTYLSDSSTVEFSCAEPGAASTVAGCWRALQPIIELTIGVAIPGAGVGANANTGITPTPVANSGLHSTRNLDCVFGTAAQNGKWETSNCVTNFGGIPVSTQALGTAPALAAGIVAATYTFAAVAATAPAKFGSICEKDVAPTTPAPPTTTAPTGTSDSTCLKSGITVMIGMLFFCYQ